MIRNPTLEPAMALLPACLVAIGLLAYAPPSPPAPERAVHIRIEGPLDVGTLSLVQRAAREARSSDSPLLVEIDTPGGEVELMWQIARALDEAASSGTLTAAWVHDRALSAGALIAISCTRLYMRPQGVIGAAAPVMFRPDGTIGGAPDPTMQAKEEAALRSLFRGWAEQHGRPPALAEAMVAREVGVRQVREAGELRLITESEWDDARMRGDPPELVRTIVRTGNLLSLSGAEAVELGLADGLAESAEEVLDKIGAGGAEPVLLERTRSEDLAALLDQLRFLLLVGGIAFAYIEFKTAGFGIFGILSIGCFALFLFGRYLVGLADVLNIVLVAAGLILIAVEIFALPGTLWPGLAGGVLVLAGLFLSSVDPRFEYEIDRRMVLDAAFGLALWTTVGLLGALALGRALPHAPVISRLVLKGGAERLTGGALPEARTVGEKRALIGSSGRALTPLRPVGKVELAALAGQELEARSGGEAIESGARVRVVDVSSGRLVVEAEDGGGTSA
jgi:membrane-bound serine protease (ClpP class)